MKGWIIPAITIVAVSLAGFGVGWLANDQDDAGVPLAAEAAPTPVSPVRLDLEAAQRERDGLCLEALQADAAAKAACEARPSRTGRPIFCGTPPEIQTQIDRYC